MPNYAKRSVEVWNYVRSHLELHVAMQHLGLISNTLLLPSLKFFIPFTKASPIAPPGALDDFTVPSVLRWVGSLFISAAPFVAWVMAQRLLREWKPQIWSTVFKHVPNTMVRGKRAPPLPPPALPPPPPPPYTPPPEPSQNGNEQHAPPADHGGQQVGPSHSHGSDTRSSDTSGFAEPLGQRSRSSTRGDEYASDEDDNEGVSATLISFDVETTESVDAPSGLWSAELRPTNCPCHDPSSMATQQPLYLDTLLTQLPALIGAHIFTESITRLVIAPYEATALRLLARTLRMKQGLPCQDIHATSFLSGLSWAAATNFLITEFVHLTLCGEVWAVFTGLTHWYHRTEQEWKAAEAET